MSKKFIPLYILILFSFFSVIAQQCDEMDTDKCEEYIPSDSDNDKQCIYVFQENVEKCQLKSCSELPSGFCQHYKPKNKEYKCIEKYDTEGCELQKCTELDPSQCPMFEPDDKEYQCLENEKTHVCELKKCSDYDVKECENFTPTNYNKTCIAVEGTCQEKECIDYQNPNCGNYIPRDPAQKCISNGNGCALVDKECEEMDYDYCQYYNAPAELAVKEVKCVEKEDGSGCKLVGCHFLRSNQCSTYEFPNDLKLCVSDGNNGCEIKSCYATQKGNCDQFNEIVSSSSKNIKEFKCVEPQQEGISNCQEERKVCEDYKYNECSYFLTYDQELSFEITNDAKRCIPKVDNTTCEAKSCSELSANECNRFNSNINYNFYVESQCIPKKDNSGCEIKACEELPADECGRVTNDFWRCEKVNNECTKKYKECSEIPLDLCEFSFPAEQGCLLSDSGDKCLSQREYDGLGGQNEEEEEEKENETDKDKENNNVNNVNIIKLTLLSVIINMLVY